MIGSAVLALTDRHAPYDGNNPLTASHGQKRPDFGQVRAIFDTWCNRN